MGGVAIAIASTAAESAGAGVHGLEDALRDEGSTEDIALRAKLAAAPALVPLDWILRSLAARGLLAEPAGQGRGRHGTANLFRWWVRVWPTLRGRVGP